MIRIPSVRALRIRLAAAAGALLGALGAMATPWLSQRYPALTLWTWLVALSVWFALGWRVARHVESRDADTKVLFRFVPWPLWAPAFVWLLLMDLDVASATGLFGRHLGSWFIFDCEWPLLGLYTLFLGTVLTYNILRLNLTMSFSRRKPRPIL